MTEPEPQTAAPAAEPTTTINDPAVMRALAHPARLAVLDHLSHAEDGATATQVAEIVGLSPSAMSYHLRALAKVGMIEEAPGRGDGRERVWQARYKQFSVGGGGRDDAPEVIAAEAQFVEAFLARSNDRVRRHLAKVRDEPEEWFELSRISEHTLLLTPEEFQTFLKAFDALIEPLKRTQRSSAPPTARTISVHFRAFPED
ncbi:winged helix-turn-helix domain-containing protein [Catelliglobosispora koreensis]|uniref:winged helix-turn-helix domain-containing protein n=1 Tax=Catelliglobosispora koreensis TaxID=129052 RepID=UPI0003666234|nr:winged helix-turn-helix domain-containing protein [Catelliglobosispora koreensis]